MKRPSLTSQVRAASAVAGFLGTDLTTERAKNNTGEPALRFVWWCMEGGSHVVKAGARFFSVDLVLGEVALRVGEMPRR